MANKKELTTEQIAQKSHDDWLGEPTNSNTVMTKTETLSQISERMQKLEDEVQLLRRKTPFIQNGTVKVESVDNGANGDRFAPCLNVVFPVAFAGTPSVHVSLCLLEAADSRKEAPRSTIRVFVFSENVTKEGFNLRLKTWKSSRVYQAEVAWLAYAPLAS